MERINFTKHALEDRGDRIVFIATTIGFGEVIAEFQVENEKGLHWECITDTGVIIVKTLDRKKVITMFIAQYGQICKLYKNEKDIPLSLARVVKRNQKRRLMEKSEL